VSLRFRFRVGPFVYDEKLTRGDRRPVKLDKRDFWPLFAAAGMLAFLLGTVIAGVMFGG
jgi:hypothetical protein